MRSVRLLAQVLVLGLALGVLAAAEMWRSHERATVAAERFIEGLTKLLAEQTESTIQAIDLTLIGMRDALQLVPSLPPNDPAYRGAMLERLKSLPYLRALFVIGADGFITHDTDYPWTPRVSLEDRDYFQAHRKDPGLGLHIGRPLLSRSVGVWFVSFSRRFSNPDGSFGGIVVAALEPRYFNRFYKDLSPEKDDLIALVLRDGTLLARTPEDESAIGKTFPEVRQHIDELGRLGGVAWGVSPIGGRTGILAYRPVADGAVVVVAGQAKEAIYKTWLRHTAMVAGGAIVVWLLTAGLAIISHNNRRRAEMEQARVAQSRRLETMGRIVGGIAHDLGNTIRIVRTTLTLLKPSLPSQSDAMALVEQADGALKSAFEIIDRLLAYARKQELSPRPTDLAALIAGFAPILRQAAGPRIDLCLNLAAAPLVCSIDPIHLESALLNLVLNSRDATPEGGHIVISLRETPAPRRRFRMGSVAAKKGTWAEIAVKDDGVGMSREVMDHAFEPFFTTRTGGSGLGLSQVLGFVQQSAGDIRIDSREGHGTTVRLLFPTTSEPAVAPPGSP